MSQGICHHRYAFIRLLHITTDRSFVTRETFWGDDVLWTWNDATPTIVPRGSGQLSLYVQLDIDVDIAIC